MWGKLKNYRAKHFIFFDTVAACVVFAILFFVVRFTPFKGLVEFPISHFSDKDVGDLYLTLSGIFSGLLGFIIAAGAIIFTIDDGPHIKILKNNPYYNQIIFTYINTSKYLFFASVVFLGFFIYTDIKTFSALRLYVILFTILLVGVKIWRCLNILKRIFVLSNKSGKAPKGGEELKIK